MKIYACSARTSRLLFSRGHTQTDIDKSIISVDDAVDGKVVSLSAYNPLTRPYNAPDGFIGKALKDVKRFNSSLICHIQRWGTVGMDTSILALAGLVD